jgi:hypothetical protein
MGLAEEMEIRKYTTAISKGAAMIEETRRLLEYWEPGEDADAFAKRVQEQGLVGSATAYRTKDILRRVFAPRLLRPTDNPARLLKKITLSRLPARTFNELLFVYIARFDPLVYDYTTQEYWPSVRRGKKVAETDSFLSFLSGAMIDGRLDSQWSDKVSVRIARCVLALYRDIGFLKEAKRGRKEVADFRATDEGVALLARELNESGVTDSSIHQHPDWGLWGMSGPGVLERLDGIGEHRGLILQRAGSVVHLTWVVKSMEELIDVLSR